MSFFVVPRTLTPPNQPPVHGFTVTHTDFGSPFFTSYEDALAYSIEFHGPSEESDDSIDDVSADPSPFDPHFLTNSHHFQDLLSWFKQERLRKERMVQIYHYSKKAREFLGPNHVDSGEYAPMTDVQMLAERMRGYDNTGSPFLYYEYLNVEQ